MRDFRASRIVSIPPFGIRRFFDIATAMENVISVGISEPDFNSPFPIVDVGIHLLKAGRMYQTSNSGIHELREAILQNLLQRYSASHGPASEVLATVRVSNGLYLALAAV